MLIFVPLDSPALREWAQRGRHRPAVGYAVTTAMRDAFGFTTADDEEAEHTALHIAGLSSLLSSQRRLVAVADTPANPIPAADFGDVTVGAVSWSAVSALFGESAPLAADVLHRRLTGLDLPTAWDAEGVADFLGEYELLWHGPGEWTSLAGE